MGISKNYILFIVLNDNIDEFKRIWNKERELLLRKKFDLVSRRLSFLRTNGILVCPNLDRVGILNYTAYNKGAGKIFEFLVSQGVPILDKNGQTPLFYAFLEYTRENTDFETHKEILDNLLNLIPNLFQIKSKYTIPALLIPIISGNLKTFEYFVSKGADINELGPENNTLLHYCFMLGRYEIAKYICQNFDVSKIINTPNDFGYRPLSFLLANDVYDLNEFVVRKNEYLQEVNQKKFEVFKTLLIKDAYINTPDVMEVINSRPIDRKIMYILGILGANIDPMKWIFGI